MWPARPVTEALREVLIGLGCEADPVVSVEFKGWEFDFRYRGGRFCCRATQIDRYVAYFSKLGAWRPGGGRPLYRELLDRLEEAVARDGRFREVRWCSHDDFDPDQDGAPRPAGPVEAPPAALSDVQVSERDGVWSDLSPHPIRRWIARTFDFWATTGLVFAALCLPLALLGRPAGLWIVAGTLGFIYLASPVRGVATALLNALMVSATSTTPGKWLCGVRIVRKDRAPMSFKLAFRRELKVLIFGCAVYVPLIALFAMGFNFSELRRRGVADWDEECDQFVLQRPNSAAQVALAALAVVMLVVTVVGLIAAFSGAAKKP